MRNIKFIFWILLVFALPAQGFAQKMVRQLISLNNNWETRLTETNGSKGASKTTNRPWKKGNIPHNWDDYAGARNLSHGNLHGTAAYKKTFTAPNAGPGKRYFLRFDGVGTYATVKLNGKNLGRHLGGRTTFTLDITAAVKPGKPNLLEVEAAHPELIADMPWVCGGCSSEYGFSEGSQPFGIFRPVWLEITPASRIEPFGVHVWNDEKADKIFINTELKNYSNKPDTLLLNQVFRNGEGAIIFRQTEPVVLKAGEVRIVRQSAPVTKAKRWSVEHPYLYNLQTLVERKKQTIDETLTPVGIRTISWPVLRKDGDQRFYLNDKPVFINGTCEYEHQFGQSHAFSNEQVQARVKQIKAAGFNAFRDAHQPHHLLYQQLLDEQGILFWTQMSAHIWYDTPEFRENFKNLLRQWVKERRNSPSVIMWGLQNESTLPRAFAEECSEIIREMDPTARNQRTITTCNGGEGTDWNVVQNWSGTYGGDVYKYNSELSAPNQLLNGEYGAWRSIDLHTEGEFEPKGIWSEDRMNLLMETKVRLAEKARDSVCGQFQWIFSSHDNPGRKQPDEGYRMIDKVGPFNYKGLVTPWEEPLDVYYMYRANYVSAKTDPMVYLVSHTWPNRFTQPTKATLRVFSNCDEVELFNDASRNISLGKRKKGGIGTHFIWDSAMVQYNVLYAVGYEAGKAVAEDLIVLDNLPTAPAFNGLYNNDKALLKGQTNYNYLYRVNCGGDAYTDSHQQSWSGDVALGKQSGRWGSVSWADGYDSLHPYLGSQRRTFDPIKNSKDWPLFQSFRYGRHQLQYQFPVPDGKYLVELYFTEPWHGTGGNKDASGLRIFDVAINNQTVVNDLDIWQQAGHDGAYKKTVEVMVKGGVLKIHFPEVKAGQALIAGIAIASKNKTLKPAPAAKNELGSWANLPTRVALPHSELPEDPNARKAMVYLASAAKTTGAIDTLGLEKQPGIFFANNESASIEWKFSTGLAQENALRFRFMNRTAKPIPVRVRLIASNGVVLKDDIIPFSDTPAKWRMISTTTGGFINAGHYTLLLSGENLQGLGFESLEVQ